MVVTARSRLQRRRNRLRMGGPKGDQNHAIHASHDLLCMICSPELRVFGLNRSVWTPGGQGVAGSNPVSPTKKSRKLKGFRDFSLVRFDPAI